MVEGEESDMRRLGISKIDNELRIKDEGNGFNTEAGVASRNL